MIVWNLLDTQAAWAYGISMMYALGLGTVDGPTTSQFTLRSGSDSIVFKGSFTLDNQGKLTNGTITGLEIEHGGVTLAEATGYGIPLGEFVPALVDFQNNPPGPAGGGEQMYALLDGDGRTVNGSGNSDLMGGTPYEDRFYGNGGNDQIVGHGGKDSLLGGAGNDIIDGGAGNDFLDGGAGADAMGGALGDDTYVVDNAGDIIFEAPLQGKDTVRASVSFVLPFNVEDLILTGSGNINGAGNGLANIITGNAGNNVLAGLGGKDQIDGNDGIDRASYAEKTGAVSVTLSGATKAAVLVNGVAEDTVRNVEDLTGGSGDDALTGDSLSNSFIGGLGNDVLSGLAGADVLAGSSGDDTLSGGAGKDLLIGGEDADTFRFDVRFKKANADQIDDFVVGEDAITLAGSVFKKLKPGSLKAKQFQAGKEAGDAADRAIYDQKSGKLWYDLDGSNEGFKKALVAKFDKGLDLTHEDFVVI